MASEFYARSSENDLPDTIATSIQYLTNKDLTMVIYPRTITDTINEPLSGDTLTTILKSLWRSVTTISERDKIPIDARGTNMIVRVNDDGKGNVKYYRWNPSSGEWAEETFPVEEKEITVDDFPELKINLYWNDMSSPSNMQAGKRIIKMAFGPDSQYQDKYRVYVSNPSSKALDEDCLYICDDTQRIYKGTNKIGGRYIVIGGTLPEPSHAVEDTLYIVRNSKEFYMCILNVSKTGYDKLVDIGVGNSDNSNIGTFLPI